MGTVVPPPPPPPHAETHKLTAVTAKPSAKRFDFFILRLQKSLDEGVKPARIGLQRIQSPCILMNFLVGRLALVFAST